MCTDTPEETSLPLHGKRLALVGKLASMSKRDAAQLLRENGAVVVEKPNASVDLIVVGEDGLPLLELGDLDRFLDDATRQAAEQGQIEIIPETRLWQRLGMVEAESDAHRLYTPAMLADLLKVPVAVIRRWRRRGLIVPVREVRRLAYFDFQEVSTARRLAQMLAAGMSPQSIEKKLQRLGRLLPGVDRPLAQLSVIIEGKQILLRQGDGLIEPGGQMRFDFEAAEHGESGSSASNSILSLAEAPLPDELANSPDQIRRLAAELEEEGHLQTAVEMYRTALVAGGPVAEICFQLAELLYRLGDPHGARERYYMTIELDENYVEARANLGCVLAETGQLDLAVAAFEGALAYHGDYADVHYQLARSLDELDRTNEALLHWQSFLELSPDSPWAEEARERLGRE